MEQRFYYSIASGSSGNCGLYVAGDTAVLIDLGVSLRKITSALAEVGLTLGHIAGVLITHDHIDHVKGLPMFLKKAEAPVFASHDTALALSIKHPQAKERLHTFAGGDGFTVGGIAVRSFETPHDAAGSVGYILEHAGCRFGFATDLGFVPGEIARQLRGCEAVVLESNHDPYMLQAGPYPYPLKQRVGGPRGHLSNPDCAVCAAELVKSGTKTLILAHLSEHNNMPELALEQTKNAVRGLPPCRIVVAPRERMEAPIVLTEEEQCSLFG
ncbi:MBL fold metallo-hydrolase [Agathobaculum sp.]|uniref:MBL fold metallo-hydrolase n=1 Tax=Agathobaculum sp. TaxID=2048138 RepID=UPI002A83E31C|nr:MBL fold metallo-hydrolase [Agathobaculum sp.]MDY3618321.1 MBL fold metallo-hydrolase [Agathobaculum sp.]